MEEYAPASWLHRLVSVLIPNRFLLAVVVSCFANVGLFGHMNPRSSSRSLWGTELAQALGFRARRAISSGTHFLPKEVTQALARTRREGTVSLLGRLHEREGVTGGQPEVGRGIWPRRRSEKVAGLPGVSPSLAAGGFLPLLGTTPGTGGAKAATAANRVLEGQPRKASVIARPPQAFTLPVPCAPSLARGAESCLITAVKERPRRPVLRLIRV